MTGTRQDDFHPRTAHSRRTHLPSSWFRSYALSGCLPQETQTRIRPRPPCIAGMAPCSVLRTSFFDACSRVNTRSAAGRRVYDAEAEAHLHNWHAIALRDFGSWLAPPAAPPA